MASIINSTSSTQISLIELQAVCKSFKKTDKPDLLVLDDLSFTLNEKEIVAILGKSGSGKSTLLRIIAGLTKPTLGKVLFQGKVVEGPAQGMAMVFQNFALMPWLTVLQNVELGLEAKGIPKNIRRARALETIDMVGMDGFESAYPKELSGGMCQRIGLARALAVNPDILLMDEPFSALDVLTGENLRSDLLDLWLSGKTNIKAIIIVTHNIEEAAFLADRIFVFDTNPGRISNKLEVTIPYPRNEQSSNFRALVDNIYTLMTAKREKTTQFGPQDKTIGRHHRLPQAPISELTGLVEALHSPEYKDKADLPKIAEEQHLNVDDLFPLTETLEILRFAHVSEGDIELTTIGQSFAEANILERKKIFAKQLLRHVPLASYIRHILDARPGHTASKERFLSELEDHLSQESAEEVLKTLIDWGRYAELFAFDANANKLSLENPKPDSAQ